MVRKYEGKIPKSGKQVFEFSGLVFCHRNIKKDGSDLLISHPDGWVIAAFPRGTERSVVLDKLAERFDLVKEFLNDPEGYNNRIESDSCKQAEGIDNKEGEACDQQDILPSEVSRVQGQPEEADAGEVELPYYGRRSRGESSILIGDAEKLELEEKGFIPF